MVWKIWWCVRCFNCALRQEVSLLCNLCLTGPGVSQTYTNIFIKAQRGLCHLGSNAPCQHRTSTIINICFHNSPHSVPREMLLHVSCSMTSKEKVSTPEFCESLWIVPLLTSETNWFRWGVFEWQTLLGKRQINLSNSLRQYECNKYLNDEIQFPRSAMHLFSCFSSGSKSQFQRCLWIKPVFEY